MPTPMTFSAQAIATGGASNRFHRFQLLIVSSSAYNLSDIFKKMLTSYWAAKFYQRTG